MLLCFHKFSCFAVCILSEISVARCSSVFKTFDSGTPQNDCSASSVTLMTATVSCCSFRRFYGNEIVTVKLRTWVFSVSFMKIRIFWDMTVDVLTSEDIGSKFVQNVKEPLTQGHSVTDLEGWNATRVVLKVMSNFYLHANWEQQTKESAVVDGTSCCVILECLVTSIACIT